MTGTFGSAAPAPFWTRRPVLTLVAVWTAATVLATALGVVLIRPNLTLLQDLARRGVTVTGTVTQSVPHDHGRVHYVYRADGARYEGDDAPSPPNPSADGLAPGDAIRIVYDRTHPQRSCACTAADRAAGDRFFVLFGGLFLGTWITVAAVVHVTLRRRGQALELNRASPAATSTTT